MHGAISRDIGTHAQEDNREGPGLGHTDQAMFVCYQNSTQPFPLVFSPAELMYGHTLRTPADLLIDQWMEADSPPFKVTEWMEQLNSRMEALREASLINGIEAQKQTKAYYDHHARQCPITVGSLVLLRSPGMAGKLESAWTGPFEILRKIGAVDVELGIPGKTSKKRKTVHINLTKPYNIRECKVMRVMVVSHETEPERDTTTLCGDQTTAVQKQIILDIIKNRPHILSDAPGMTSLCVHHIDTECVKPIRSAPYSISAAKIKGVIKELQGLIDQGILIPSTSPWASPLVPVMKPDGSIRVCMDYRKLNAVTVPDPYCMPLIEDIINRVGAAVFLTQMDLSKGFYQVRIHPADQPKTAIVTPIGKFQFVKMPFGLRNAPTTFQRLMNRVLDGMEGYIAP